jgi:hypothetical protein
MISGLLCNSSPVLLVTVLVAVVGASGTAYAVKPSEKSHGTSQTHKSHKGHKGHKHDESAEYGVATVWVSRGPNPATAWATYSTRLGSPVGDTTGGVFRFTCSEANAPCTVSVKAAVLSDSNGTVQVYPRVLIYTQSLAGGPMVYCEYADGSTGIGSDGAPVPIAKQDPSSSPTYTAMQVNIGGSADCAGPVATAGNVDVITVPAGYYDVKSTFVFLS